jgi:hypothetical protein
MPSLKAEAIRAGSEGVVRLNIEKISMINVGTIIAGLKSSLRRKSERGDGIYRTYN